MHQKSNFYFFRMRTVSFIYFPLGDLLVKQGISSEDNLFLIA